MVVAQCQLILAPNMRVHDELFENDSLQLHGKKSMRISAHASETEDGPA
jgi:hypothetical protein